MKYDNHIVPMINKTYNASFENKGKVISVVDGEIKLIQCSHMVLNDVLSCIDGVKNLNEIEKELEEAYPVEGVRKYLQVLFRENILLPVTKRKKDRRPVSACIIGSGRLFDSIYTELSMDDAMKVACSSVKECDFVNPEKGYDVVIFAPEKIKYEELMNFNKMLLKSKIPCIPYYFNGKEIILGPFVIPGKTACLECQVMHRLFDINEKLSSNNKIYLKDIESLYATMKVGDSYSDLKILYFSQIIKREIQYWKRGEPLFLVDKEFKFNDYNSLDIKNRMYYPTTECGACYGISQSYKKWGESIGVPEDRKMSLEKSEICYEVGGLRSKDEKDTRKIIDKALENAGVKVSVERVTNNPFNKVVPCYVAKLEASHKNNTPYYFRKNRSHGKGLTESQAYFSASFEMIEHMSSCFLGDIPIVEAPYKEVSNLSINMDIISASIKNHYTAYDTFSPEKKIDWVWAKSLVTGKHKLVPASMVFMGDIKLKGRFFGGTSTGLASGATLPDAILQGLFEVVEHDGWLTGQTNQVALPTIDYMTSKNEALKERINTIKGMGYQVICKDYTNDIGLPVFRTWIVSPKNYTHFAYSGFGASLFPEIALERSVTEAMQGDGVVNPNNPMNNKLSGKKLLNWVNSLYSLSYFYKKDIIAKTPVKAIPKMEQINIDNVGDVLQRTISILQTKLSNVDILYVDLTKKGINIPAVRVIVDGDIQRLNIPQVSISSRTYSFPHTMGYSDQPSTYEELYLGEYPH